jgi:hypothetical protein
MSIQFKIFFCSFFLRMLASNINLLTHYAKGTLLFNRISFELLIKLLFSFIFPHGTIRYRLYIIFSLRGRFPYIQTDLHSILLIRLHLLSFTLFIESRLISFPKVTKIFQFALFINDVYLF